MSQIIKRDQFIALFCEMIRKYLVKALPEEGFETDMLARAWEILAHKCRTVLKIGIEQGG